MSLYRYEYFYIFFSLKSTDFFLFCPLKSLLQVPLLKLKMLLQSFVEGFNKIIRIFSLDRIDHRFETLQFVSKVAHLPALETAYLEIGALDSETWLKKGLNCSTKPCDFSFNALTLSLREFMASLMELMHLVTFRFEKDSLPLEAFLLDLGMFSLSSYFSSKADAALVLMGEIMERKLFPCEVWACVGCCTSLAIDLFFLCS